MKMTHRHYRIEVFLTSMKALFLVHRKCLNLAASASSKTSRPDTKSNTKNNREHFRNPNSLRDFRFVRQAPPPVELFHSANFVRESRVDGNQQGLQVMVAFSRERPRLRFQSEFHVLNNSIRDI